MDFADSTKASPEVEVLAIAAAEDLTFELGHPFAVKNRFDDKIEDMAGTTKTSPPLQCWNLPTKVIHHGVVVMRVVHHETADLMAKFVLINNVTKGLCEVLAIMAAEEARKAYKGRLATVFIVNEVSDDAEQREMFS